MFDIYWLKSQEASIHIWTYEYKLQTVYAEIEQSG